MVVETFVDNVVPIRPARSSEEDCLVHFLLCFRLRKQINFDETNRKVGRN